LLADATMRSGTSVADRPCASRSAASAATTGYQGADEIRMVRVDAGVRHGDHDTGPGRGRPGVREPRRRQPVLLAEPGIVRGRARTRRRDPGERDPQRHGGGAREALPADERRRRARAATPTRIAAATRSVGSVDVERRAGDPSRTMIG